MLYLTRISSQQTLCQPTEILRRLSTTYSVAGSLQFEYLDNKTFVEDLWTLRLRDVILRATMYISNDVVLVVMSGVY